ncbi:DNA polymerase III subunit delta' [candidate division FCPU426 bacterium]|nr:DNA polymerase III subunit delta' [candidate division FCPU426 bacterium]
MPFSGMAGQTQAVAFLRRSLQHGRAAHAYLFTGPEGVGKRTAALSLAQALNCPSPQAGDACGVCLACRKIQEAIHPDVHWIVPDGQNIKIEQIREHMQREAFLKPLEGRTKFFGIDPAEALTTEAANSLLKLLEEPPQDVVVVLLSNQPFLLLETVRSRCQEVRFHPLARSVLASWLGQRLGCSAAEAETWAMLSGGRPAEALRLADAEHQELRGRVLGMLQHFPQEDWAVLANRWEEERADLGEALEYMLTWYRDLLVLAHHGDPELVWNRDQADMLRQAVAKEGADSLFAKCRLLVDTMDALKKNMNIQLLLENVFMQLGRKA